jgi:NDP-sugar pyrophosphorylase family protein
LNQFNLENDPLVSFIPGVKVVILAGGLGSRLSEETTLRPKPMVEIGGLPILWHILKGYEHPGFNDFVIALGYKAKCLKDYLSPLPDAEREPHRGSGDQQMRIVLRAGGELETTTRGHLSIAFFRVATFRLDPAELAG